MNRNVIMGLALALAPIAAGASECDGPKQEPQGLVTDISGPPLAQTYGCGQKLWHIGVLPKADAANSALTPTQKAARVKKTCVTEKVAKKYTVNGEYP